MGVPLLGMLLRSAMGAAAGTTRLAAMTANSGRNMIGQLGMRRGGSAGRNNFQLAPRQDTTEMSALRQRMRSPLSTAEQKQSDRRQLAQLLLAQRSKRHRERDSLHEARNRSSPFGRKIGEMTTSMARSSVKLLAFGAAAGSAAVSMSRLTHASNSRVIEDLKNYNPEIAALASRNALADIQLKMQRGQAVARTTRQASDRMLEFKKKFADYRIYGDHSLNLSGDLLAAAGLKAIEYAEKIGLGEMVRKINAELGQGGGKSRGHLLSELDKVLNGSLTADPKLQNRRPNEPPRGRM